MKKHLLCILILLLIFSPVTTFPFSILVIGDSNTELCQITLPLADTLQKFFPFSGKGTGYAPLSAAFYGIRDGKYDGVSVTNDAAWTKADMFEGSRSARLCHMIRHVSRKPHYEQIAQSLVKQVFGRNARVAATENCGKRFLA